MTTTTTDAITTDVNDSQGLAERVRGAVDGLWNRIRTTLDIPSRAELSDLLDRIEALDAKLAALEEQPKPAKKKTVSKKSTANKTARREQIKSAAKKRKR